MTLTVRARALALFFLAIVWIPVAGAQQLSISDVSIAEGNAGSKTMTFTIKLSAASAEPVRVDVTTSDGTATAGSDYLASSVLPLRFAAGTTSRNFAVSILGDTALESNETLQVNLSNAVGATISDPQAIGTINNDDVSQSTLSIGDVSVSEQTSGPITATFTVSLSAAASTGVTFDIATADGSATAGSDYVASSLLAQTIPAGQTSKTFSVTVLGDSVPEPDETYAVNVTNATGASIADAQATGTILNDDGSLPTLSVDDVSIIEGNSGSKWVTFTVGLSLTRTTPVVFNIWTTADTATNGDFVPASAVNQVIPAGSSIKDFQVEISGDTLPESDEVFHVYLEAVDGAIVEDHIGDATIVDDDSTALTLSLSNATVSEGNAGGAALMFEAKLSRPAQVPVSFDFATSDGTATAGTDYNAQSLVGILVIPPGDTSIVFPVVILGDVEAEANEFLNATISNAAGAPIARAGATGMLWNDDGNILVTAPHDPLKQAAGSTGFMSNGQSISADGRFVAFISAANDLVAGQPTNSFPDVFLRDLRTGETRLISVGYNGAASNGASGYPSVSKDGSYVVFESNASNIVAGGNAFGSVFRRDVYPETTELVSVGINGLPSATHQSNASAMSADGRFVAFQSSAPDIVASDTNGTKQDVFVRDMQTDATVLVSVAGAGPSAPVSGSQGPRVSRDGRYVSFASDDPNIVAGDTDGLVNAFTRDMQTGTTTRVDFDPGFKTYGASLSGNSRYLLFSAQDPTILQSHVYLRDLQTGATELIDVRFDGQTVPQSGAGAYSTMISDDGRYVSFSTHIGGLVENDNDGRSDVFVRDTLLDTTWRAPGLASENPALSADGKYLVYGTVSDTMSVGDGNSQADSFRVAVPQVGVPSLSIGDYWVQEGDPGLGLKQLAVTVALSAVSTSAVTFDFNTVLGLADFVDFMEKRSVGLIIPAGQLSRVVTLSIVGDSYHEPDENFGALLSNVRGAVVADDFGMIIIGNDDPLPVHVSVADASIIEGDDGNKLMNFTVSLSGPAATDVLIDALASSLVAAAGIDFANPMVDRLVIPPGETSKTITVEVIGDIEPEEDETFKLSVFSPVGNAIVTDGEAIGTIIDDDYANAPSLSIADVSATEGNSGWQTLTFRVVLSKVAASPVCFGLQLTGGTATAVEDFGDTGTNSCIPVGASGMSFNVTIIGDTLVEPNETFNVTALHVVGANVSDGAAVGTILNDDFASGPILSINDVAIVEGNAGTKIANFTAKLSAAQATAVRFDIGTANGTATAGSDYVNKAIAGLRIPPGSTSVAFAVTINGDTTMEPDETFTVNLSNPLGATIADGQATGSITNDDAAATPTLSIADASVSEGNTGTKTLTFTVTLSPAAPGAVTYNIATSNGTATSGSDYLASNLSTQTITAGLTSKTFTVTVNGDTLAEANETFSVGLAAVSGATLGDGSATGTIINDDSGSGPTLSIGDVTIAEGNSLSKQAVFTVSLSSPATGKVTFDIATANGTATAGSDYVSKSLIGQAILAGGSTKTFSVAIKGDTVAEANETFSVNVSNVIGTTTADGQATGTISNDDAAVVSVTRIDARGLYDDLDDGNGEPVLTTRDYASLLQDIAQKQCSRTELATIVAVSAVENKSALQDLADSVNALCASIPRYQAVMVTGTETGFLVESTSATDTRGIQVMSAPSADAKSGLTTLRILTSVNERPFALLIPAALPAAGAARSGRLKAIAQEVRAELSADAEPRLVLIGSLTVPGLVDLTAREWAKSDTRSDGLPAERVLVSHGLLGEFGGMRLEFMPQESGDQPAQVLQLKR